ncbi:MAG: hypothetical protein U0559_19315 [Anaerolineae bacterium]
MTDATTRTCPRCNTVNDREAGTCRTCGLQFDTLGHITAREQLRFDDRFTRRAQEVADVKAFDQAQSEERLQSMWAAEQQRQAALLAQRAAQREQERRLMTIALVVLAIAVIAVLTVVMLSAR